MRMTLSEVMKTCSDWPVFCCATGFSEWAVAEGGGDVEVELTLEDAFDYGILRKSP